jgi:hypothetical protein
MKHTNRNRNFTRRQNCRKYRSPQASPQARKLKVSVPEVPAYDDLAKKCDPIGTFAFIGCMLLAVAGFGYGLFHAIFC